MIDLAPKFFKSQTDFHRWLQNNHDKVDELIVGFYKKGSGFPSITYPEALDEALCFGWIDGIRRNIDSDSYSIRFTPRRPKSNWSNVNIKRIAELKKLGLMQPCGIKAFEASDPKRHECSYEQKVQKLDEQLEKIFRKNKAAWKFFNSQPPSYQKVSSWWVMSAKKEETRLRRLAQLIKDSEQGKRVGVVTLKKD